MRTKCGYLQCALWRSTIHIMDIHNVNYAYPQLELWMGLPTMRSADIHNVNCGYPQCVLSISTIRIMDINNFQLCVLWITTIHIADIHNSMWISTVYCL